MKSSRHPDLTADCTSCAALCCVVFAFDRSESFGVDKAAGEVCPNLDSCGRCGIFNDRSRLGFSGCIAYDCHGAGQRVTQEVFHGTSWRDNPGLTTRMGEALSVLRQIHEKLLLLTAAETLPLDHGERQTLSELQFRLAPDEDWTEARLKEFPLADISRQVSLFLTGLRRHFTAQD
jgi:hypothetical protein